MNILSHLQEGGCKVPNCSEPCHQAYLACFEHICEWKQFKRDKQLIGEVLLGFPEWCEQHRPKASCPECGEPFLVERDYLCSACRS